MYGLQIGTNEKVKTEVYSIEKESLFKEFQKIKIGKNDFAIFTNTKTGGELRRGVKKKTRFILG